jgi:predicted TPR repeat methyltransferase
MANPKLNPAVGLATLDDRYVAYNADDDRFFDLNATAALIAELCDGSRSAEEIRTLAASWMPGGGTEEVDRILGEGLDSGLLTLGDGTPDPARMLTADELTALAEHLWETNRTDAGLACARRATELDPDHPGAWQTVGRISQVFHRREDTAHAFARYLELCPGDAAIRHQLIGLRNKTPPERASDACILQTFGSFSSHYDRKMREVLAYQAPERLEELIQSQLGDSPELEILDLGCGTGLAGMVMRPRAARLTGIDLSPEMIERARERGIYDRLVIAEINGWLASAQDSFDLIVACDTLVYFGDLTQVGKLAAKALKPSGCFAFTVERGETYPHRLTDSGRYAHHPDHIRTVAEAAGFAAISVEEGFLRMEGGQEVIGLIVLLKKEPARF